MKKAEYSNKSLADLKKIAKTVNALIEEKKNASEVLADATKNELQKEWANIKSQLSALKKEKPKFTVNLSFILTLDPNPYSDDLDVKGILAYAESPDHLLDINFDQCCMEISSVKPVPGCNALSGYQKDELTSYFREEVGMDFVPEEILKRYDEFNDLVYEFVKKIKNLKVDLASLELK